MGGPQTLLLKTPRLGCGHKGRLPASGYGSPWRMWAETLGESPGACALSVMLLRARRSGKRQIRVDLTPFVKELIEVAVGEQPPVQAPAGARVLRVSPVL